MHVTKYVVCGQFIMKTPLRHLLQSCIQNNKDDECLMHKQFEKETECWQAEQLGVRCYFIYILNKVHRLNY